MAVWLPRAIILSTDLGCAWRTFSRRYGFWAMGQFGVGLFEVLAPIGLGTRTPRRVLAVASPEITRGEGGNDFKVD
jgi:hypothetical protein